MHREKPIKPEETHTPIVEDPSDMQKARVIQKNLVYVIGLPIEASSESIIRRQDMFGQYGHLNKIVVNSRNPICDKSSTCGVYLTYENNKQALDCIQAVDGFTYCHRLLKYQSFLQFLLLLEQVTVQLNIVIISLKDRSVIILIVFSFIQKQIKKIVLQKMRWLKDN